VIIESAMVLQLALAPSVLSSSEIRYFPGSYFNDVARRQLQSRAMVKWPGPSGLRQLWLEGQLKLGQRVALLLGGAAFHEPKMIWLYIEALSSKSQRLRQAAAYGYRDLIADQLPNVSPGVDDVSAELLAGEMRAMRQTLRNHSMVEMWLQAVLITEEKSFQDFRGIVLRRSPMVCFRAVERVMGPEDLETLVRAYRMSEDTRHRISLLQLIEALTLNQFIVRPLGDRKGWGERIYNKGLRALDEWITAWLDLRCTLDYGQVVSGSLAKMGATGVRPLHPEACHVWGLVLKQGDPRWWAVAARQMYACGGPWVEMSVLQADTEENRRRQESLVNWYRLRDN